MSLIQEMAQYLDNQGIGTFDEATTNGDIYIMTIPSSPDDVICLYARGGGIADGKLGYDLPSIQILVRGVNVHVNCLRRSRYAPQAHKWANVSHPRLWRTYT